jgi:hypothetical protein
MGKLCWGGENFDGPHVWQAQQENTTQDAQKGRPARPQRVKGLSEAYSLGRTVRRIRSTKSVRAAEW